MVSDKQPNTISGAIEQLRDLNPAVRQIAMDMLVGIGEPAVVPLIAALLDWGVFYRSSPGKALLDIGAPAVMPLIAALTQADAAARSEMIWLLGRIRDPRAIEPLVERLSDRDPVAPGSTLLAMGDSVRICAVDALAYIGGPRVVDTLRDSLIEAVRRRDFEMIGAAAGPFLGQRDDTPELIDLLIAALQDREAKLRFYAARALADIGDPRATDALIAALRDTGFYVDDSGTYGYEVRHYVRAGAADALGALRSVEAVDPLIAVLRDSSFGGRFEAAQALAAIDDPRSTAALRAAVIENDIEVIVPAYRALLRRGDHASEDALMAALENSPDDGMAEAYLNCGNDRLG